MAASGWRRGMVRAILGIVGSLALSVVGSECHEAAAWLSVGIVRAAARRLPHRLRLTREEEWLAELDAFDGLRVFRLFWSVGVYIAAVRLRFRYSDVVKAEASGGFTLQLSCVPGTIIALRWHPAVLISRIMPVAVWSLAAISASINVLINGTNPYQLSAWIPCLAVILVLRRQVKKWAASILLVDDEKMLLPAWPTRHTVSTIPRTAIIRVCMERTVPGRLFGYGTLHVYGSDMTSHVIRYIAFPDQVGKELEGWISPHPAR